MTPLLAREMMLILEGHPAPPFGLNFAIESMCLCRAVDQFQTSIVAFVGEIFRSEPRTMLSEAPETVDVATVLRSASLDELRSRLVRRKLRNRGGFAQVRRFIRKLGVNIVFDGETERAVVEAIALRDIIVHNNARVDEGFLRITERTDVHVDAPLRVDTDTFITFARALRAAADAFQIALGQKYFGIGESGIPRHFDLFAGKDNAKKKQ